MNSFLSPQRAALVFIGVLQERTATACYSLTYNQLNDLENFFVVDGEFGKPRAYLFIRVFCSIGEHDGNHDGG